MKWIEPIGRALEKNSHGFIDKWLKGSHCNYAGIVFLDIIDTNVHL